MPIYEFYCRACHTVFSFLSRTPDTTKRPACPRCSKPRLERRASTFAISTGRPETEAADDLPPGFDEQRMERLMAEMASEVEKVDENDPRQMAGLMRKLFDGTGLPLGPGMEQAIRRMEAGEDPDRIEEEMGDLLEREDPSMIGADAAGSAGKLGSLRRRLLPAAVDRTLYEM